MPLTCDELQTTFLADQPLWIEANGYQNVPAEELAQKWEKHQQGRIWFLQQIAQLDQLVVDVPSLKVPAGKPAHVG